MRMYDIILKKRNKEELTKEEIKFFIDGYTSDEIKDYQAAALTMALFLNGMSKREIVDYTEAIMHSGDTVDLSGIEGIKVDKHSTGGVGDTTTIVLAPLVASLGIPVAKMSGRGLGHTGGTIDKLESIKGFSTSLTQEEFIDHVNKYKIAVIGQTKSLAPADKKIYALRDVTATVDNIGLIAGSIMSKKLAAGSDAIVLDVKVGSGAFLKTLEDATELAETMVNIGEGMGRKTRAVITNMDQPLGYAIGNALEIKEAMDVLNGKGPKDLRDLCIYLGANMTILAGHAKDLEEAKAMIIEVLDNGKAFAKFREFIEIQGGDVSVIDNPDLLPTSEFKMEILATEAGYIESIDSEEVGISSMILGAGRTSLDSEIDLSAGIIMHEKIGSKVDANTVLATFHTNDKPKLEEAKARFLKAIHIVEHEVKAQKLIKAIVSINDVNYL